MFFLSGKESKARLREAENARKNRAEIVAARSQGHVMRRELLKWGILTAGGLLVAKNGLSPFATSAFAQVPTGMPPGSRRVRVPRTKLSVVRARVRVIEA